MKVLVTGAAGFIGRPLCEQLAAHGYAVTPVVRTDAVAGQLAVGDIGPDTDWQPALGSGPEVVVHLAGRVHMMRETQADSLQAYRTHNVGGTLNLARQAAAAGVRRFVYLSSIKVNGEVTAPERPFRADDAAAPGDPYAVSKTEAEAGLQELARRTGLEVVIIRPPLVYGPGVKGNFATMVRWVLKGIPLPLGAIHNRRSLVALSNLVDFIVLCADPRRSPAAANEVFLVSDGEDVSTADLLRKVARAYGVRSSLVPVPDALLRLGARIVGRSAAADRLLGSLVVDIGKARGTLGWQPVVTMEQQLQLMARHDPRP